MSLIQPGDMVMGMDFTPVVIDTWCTASLVRPITFVAYNVDKETELLDYDAILAQAKEVQPNSSLLGLQLTHVSLILLNSVKLLML